MSAKKKDSNQFKTIPKVHRNWRERVKLVTMLSAISMVLVLTASAFAGYKAFQILYRNKMQDAWALSFLELERIGGQIAKYMELASGIEGQSLGVGLEKLKSANLPDLGLRFNGNLTVSRVLGKGADSLPLSELGLSEPVFRNKLGILRVAGEDYVASSISPKGPTLLFNTNFESGSYLLLWKVKFSEWMKELPVPHPDRTLVYVVTSFGKVLFTTDYKITDLNFAKRPLVQEFISSPIPTGQIELDSAKVPSYGYFYQIPSTNVVMFVETPKELVLHEIKLAEKQYAIYLAVLVLVLFTISIIALRKALAPIRELVKLSKEIARGNFRVAARNRGFGELNQLMSAFLDMSKSLIARDEEIRELAEEQREKVRLEGELALAKNIQETLLPHDSLTKDSGIDVATQYIPASEVAGDWYNYCYNETTKESVLVIADVSGHGAGAAMYTAMIAAEFEQVRQSESESFLIGEFLSRINTLILTFGKGRWSASVLVVRYVKGANTVDLFNCGHPFPLLAFPKESGRRNETIPMRSDILGLISDPKISEVTIDFPSRACLLLFTDGLVELGGPEHKVISDRKLSKMVQFSDPQSAHEVVKHVYSGWLEMLKGHKASDDLCLMALRVAA